MTRRPIGWVLECHSPEIGTWFDFRDGPTPPAGKGWLPVVPQVDPLLEGMHTVLWDAHDKVWKVRPQGSTHWAVSDSVWDAVGLAALLVQPEPEEDPLW